MTDITANFVNGNILDADELNNWKDEREDHFLPIDSTTKNYSDGAKNIGSATYHWADAYFGNGTTLAFFVDGSATRCGIGQATPLSSLHIGDGAGSFGMRIAGNTNGNGYQLYNGGNLRANLALETAGDDTIFDLYDSGGLKIHLDTDGGSYFTGGNVFIGSTTGDSPLHVFNGSAGTVTAITGTVSTIEGSGAAVYGSFLSSNTATVGWVFGDTDDNDVGSILYNHSTNAMIFKTATANAGAFDSSGKFGIGNIAPSHLGDFSKATSGSTNILAIRNTSNTTDSSSQLLIQVAGTSGGDPVLQWAVSGTTFFYAGIDNSDSDNWKLSTSSDLSSESIRVDSSDGSVAIKDANGSLLKTKIIEIGNWNMDSTVYVDVAHGLTLANIRTVTVTVRNDDGTAIYNSSYYNLLASGDNSAFGPITDATNVRCQRITGHSTFDGSADFDASPYNRGWVTICYVD